MMRVKRAVLTYWDINNLNVKDVNTALLTLIINGSLSEIGAKNYIFATTKYFKFGFFTGEIFDYHIFGHIYVDFLILRRNIGR